MNLSDRNVLVVTLDSCRFDTAARAATPHLDRLGPLTKAETAGTYTLPAHVAFFGGELPAPVEGSCTLADSRWASIWRSAAARPTARTAAIVFTGSTFLDHYRSSGHRVLGAGGVTFFDPAEKSNWLPSLFDEFRYFGKPNMPPGPTVRGLADRVADRDGVLTLAHVRELAAWCRPADRFLLFVNCPCTHIPYTTPWSRLTSSTADLLTRLYELHDSRHRGGGQIFTPAQLACLRAMQVSALEWADYRLGVLFAALADREPLVVVCADHGEEFGDGGRYGHGHPHPSVTTVPLWCGILTRHDLR